jgi:hypothetical protein
MYTIKEIFTEWDKIMPLKDILVFCYLIGLKQLTEEILPDRLRSILGKGLVSHLSEFSVAKEQRGCPN